jgi:hypothetical protein
MVEGSVRGVIVKNVERNNHSWNLSPETEDKYENLTEINVLGDSLR